MSILASTRRTNVVQNWLPCPRSERESNKDPLWNKWRREQFQTVLTNDWILGWLNVVIISVTCYQIAVTVYRQWLPSEDISEYKGFGGWMLGGIDVIQNCLLLLLLSVVFLCAELGWKTTNTVCAKNNSNSCWHCDWLILPSVQIQLLPLSCSLALDQMKTQCWIRGRNRQFNSLVKNLLRSLGTTLLAFLMSHLKGTVLLKLFSIYFPCVFAQSTSKIYSKRTLINVVWKPKIV